MGIGDELVKNKLKKKLKKIGYDFDKPKETTFRVIGNLIETSTYNYIKPAEMIEFLEDHIKKLKMRT